ncbi:hypothetical protein Hanom_Chr00s003171g01710221 [Helianthus anomalus]
MIGLHLLLRYINYMFDMIGGLILVSHAPKRWCSASGFWGCDSDRVQNFEFSFCC